MYGYIYETINLINGKKYIGQKKSSVFLEQKYRMGSSNRGKKLSDETKRKMSNYWKGKSKPWMMVPKSDETKRKISETSKHRSRDSHGHFIKEVT